MELALYVGAAIVGPWIAWHKRDEWRGSPVVLALATIYPAKLAVLVLRVAL